MPIIFLEPADQPGDPHVGDEHRTLERELFRQGLLLSAREDFGLITRDSTLREEPPDDLPVDNRLFVTPFTTRSKTPSRIPIERRKNGKREMVWQYEDPGINDKLGRMGVLIASAEEISRHEFAEALIAAGFKRKPKKRNVDLKVPPEVEKLLHEMTFTSQYAAMRELHRLIRADGESPWLLGALSRAYAHLGMLCECHWSSADRVYKARALLYAQRLVSAGMDSGAANSRSPWGLWHLAYAEALSGMHNVALDDLAKAQKLMVPPGTPTPAWVGLIEPFCRFDLAKLKELSRDAEITPIASLMRFLSVCSLNAPLFMLATAKEALDEMPECYRIHDGIANVGGVAAQHQTTIAGKKIFEQNFKLRVAAQRELPARVKRTLDAQEDDIAVINALAAREQRSADATEPSWSLLGQWARDERFVQAAQRLRFLQESLAVPIDDFLLEAKAMTADHPCAAFIESFGVDRQRETKRYLDVLARIPRRDLDCRQMAWIKEIKEFDRKGEALSLLNAVVANMDYYCYFDMRLALLDLYDSKKQADNMHVMRACSEHAPLAKALIAVLDYRQAESHADEWQKDCQHPDILISFGMSYSRLGRHADAERCLKRALEISPESVAYRELADVYKAQGKTDLWVATLEELLKEPDPGLSHANIRVVIARHFMAKKEYRKALPYAEAAAQSWAQWAILCAVDCYEGLQDWDKAEMSMRKICERYPTEIPEWFFWCKKTGHGDIRAARRMFEQYFQDLGERKTGNDQLLFAEYLVMSGEHRRAADRLTMLGRSARAEYPMLLAALEYDLIKDVRRRDLVVADFAALEHTWLLALAAGMFREGDKVSFDSKATFERCDAVTAKYRPICYYLLGRLLVQHGRKTEGVESFKRGIAWSEYYVHVAMNRAELLALGVDPKTIPEPGSAAAEVQAQEAARKVDLVDLEPFETHPGPWPLGKGMTGSIEENTPIVVGGTRHPKALGLHAGKGQMPAIVKYRLDKTASRFNCQVAFDDSNDGKVSGPTYFEVYGDGRLLWKSQPIKTRRLAQKCDVDVSGVVVLELHVWTDGDNFGAHAVWVDPFLIGKDPAAIRKASDGK